MEILLESASLIQSSQNSFRDLLIITVSEANSDAALRCSVTKAENLVRIWNGVPDTDMRSRPGSHDQVTFIMVARFAPQKDHATVLRALAGVSGDWRMLFVGDGPQQLEMVRLAQALGLESRVAFLGDRGDTAGLLSLADAFILTTNWEGLPLSILEAMRAGLPVIATNVGGVAEAVEHGRTGWLLNRGDVQQAQALLQKVVSSPDLLAPMGQAGRQRYEQDFRIDIMMQKTLAVYREALPASPTLAVSQTAKPVDEV